MGQPVTVACDGRCEKAWGSHRRPRLQLGYALADFAYLADDELGDAPVDPGTHEGDEAKPTSPEQRLNKWCVRECERSVMVDRNDEATTSIDLPDFSRRRHNMAPSVRRTFTPEIPDTWEPFIGALPIDIDPEKIRWDEDIWSARYRPNPNWNIWIDGGKDLSTWQCTLAQTFPAKDGGLERDHLRLMRDFVETPEQVQAWIDRAVVIAARAEAEDRKRAAEEKT